MMAKIEWQRIMLHHSFTDDSGTVSWSAIRRFHMQERGWNDIGYHFGVELVSDTYEALVGRALDTYGAHCPEGNCNRDAIGICLVGNFDKAPPPDQQMIVLRDRLLNPLMDEFGITADRIIFHREFAPWKSCPGTALTFAYLKQFVPGVRA